MQYSHNRGESGKEREREEEMEKERGGGEGGRMGEVDRR